MGGQKNPQGGFGRESPPDLNHFPPAGEAGGKIINDFISDFPPAGEAGGKMINDFINGFLNDLPPAGEASGK